MPTSDATMEIEALRFARGDRVILSDLNIRIRRGQVTAIIGGSGTGKTTLLQLMSGQLRPSAGQVRLNGALLSDLEGRDLYALRRRMGLLFQHSALFSDLSVFDNVAFPLRWHSRLPASMLRSLVLMKLEAVGLRGAQDRMPVELSGGMARRVALARAIAMDPDLILYDEPFTGLDPISLGVIVSLIKRLNQALGASSVIVSHDVAETLSIADYVYILAEGRVIEEGTPEMLWKSTAPVVKQFLYGTPDGPVPFHYPSERHYQQDLLVVRSVKTVTQ